MAEEARGVMDGWDWFGGAIMMLLFWSVPAAVIVFGIRAFGARSRHDAGAAEDPQKILEIRFAKGEITEEELEERRRVLAARAQGNSAVLRELSDDQGGAFT